MYMKEKSKYRQFLCLIIALCFMATAAEGCSRKEAGTSETWSFQAGGTSQENAEKSSADPVAGDSTAEAASELQKNAAAIGENSENISDSAAAGSSSEIANVDAIESSSEITNDAMDSDTSGVGGLMQEENCDLNTPHGYVYVCGAVEHPGVYEIYEGMRVFEVLELAGGMTSEADLEWINQARTVTDGQQLRIYTREETAQMKSSGLSEGADMVSGEAEPSGVPEEKKTAGEKKVNINTADREELMTLPGIGEAKAEAILSYRQEHGAFGSIEEICQISGIKEAVFSNIKDRITV